jgi:hypothetical protein
MRENPYSKNCPTASSEIGCINEAISKRMSERYSRISKVDSDYFFSRGVSAQTAKLLSREVKVIGGKNCTCLPLKSSSTLNTIIDVLKLPRTYPHDIAHRHHVPVRLNRMPNGTIDNIGELPLSHILADASANRQKESCARTPDLPELHDHGAIILTQRHGSHQAFVVTLPRVPITLQ